MHSKLIIPLALVVVVAAVALFAQADVPQNMNAQGRLTDASGAPLGPQVFIFTFKIFDMEVGGTEIWPNGPGEIHAIATSDNGLWNATLGTFVALTPAVFADSSRWLQITVDDAINPAEVLGRTKLSMSPYTGRSSTAKRADNGVPVGTVIDWWRASGSFPVPGGYLICDGSTVSDPESPLNGFALPDLRNQFVVGANTLGDIGATGGSASHTHNHDHVNQSHSHSVDPPNTASTTSSSHSHSVNPASTSSTSDSHNHLWSYLTTGENWFSHTSAGASTLMYNHPVGGNGVAGSNNTFPIAIADADGDVTSGLNFYTENDTHNHTVDIGATTSSSTGGHSHTTNINPFTSTTAGVDLPSVTSSSTSSLPPNVALMKIMRIK